MKYTKEERHKIYKRALKIYTKKYAMYSEYENIYYLRYGYYLRHGLCKVFENMRGKYCLMDFPEIYDKMEDIRKDMSYNCDYWWWQDCGIAAWKIRRKILRDALNATNKC